MARSAAERFGLAMSIVGRGATIPRELMERSPAVVPDPDPRERALAHTLGLPELVARVLLARKLDDPERIREHIKPQLGRLHDPFAFRQMEQAVDRIHRAVRDGEPILIHGDYDVDGITGTVVLLQLFKLFEATVRPFIPSRNDGYSFCQASLDAVRRGGFRLCISVDNGTNACEFIDRIQAEGCDVIVTDHHGTSENVAAAHAILNPRLPDAGYPDRELAGVGVAFRLASAVAQRFSAGKIMSREFREFLVDAVAYVALGTVADVAPLRGENRILVHHGLRALAASRNPGILALLDAAKLAGRSPTAEDIAFRIAPLLNAAGRMGCALEAVALLVAPGYQEAQQAARALERHNTQRRAVERQITEEALGAAREFADDPIIVLGQDGWHAGVLGIVASRVAETLGKPAILVALDGERARGSGRSANLLHLRDALAACSSCLVSHGGHAAAVGLELHRDELPRFRRMINERAGNLVQALAPHAADAHASLRELEPRDVRKLDLLGPFGAGNHRPRFLTRPVRLVGQPTVDARGQDLRLRVAQDGVVLPARLVGQASRFEELRALREAVGLVHTPRVAARGENGPVELHVHELHRVAAP
jgi:single-stranded-DNA-specific exonuclease